MGSYRLCIFGVLLTTRGKLYLSHILANAGMTNGAKHQDKFLNCVLLLGDFQCEHHQVDTYEFDAEYV